jgi:hypothetical protein
VGLLGPEPRESPVKRPCAAKSTVWVRPVVENSFHFQNKNVTFRRPSLERSASVTCACDVCEARPLLEVTLPLDIHSTSWQTKQSRARACWEAVTFSLMSL